MHHSPRVRQHLFFVPGLKISNKALYGVYVLFLLPLAVSLFFWSISALRESLRIPSVFERNVTAIFVA